MLQKTSQEINDEADMASKLAFGIPVNVSEIFDRSIPVRQHFIDRPSIDELFPLKSDEEFLRELKAETKDRNSTLSAGSVATEHVVEVDFSQSGQESVIEVSRDDVA